MHRVVVEEPRHGWWTSRWVRMVDRELIALLRTEGVRRVERDAWDLLRAHARTLRSNTIRARTES